MEVKPRYELADVHTSKEQSARPGAKACRKHWSELIIDHMLEFLRRKSLMPYARLCSLVSNMKGCFFVTSYRKDGSRIPSSVVAFIVAEIFPTWSVD